MFNKLRDMLKLPDAGTLLSNLATKFGNYERQYPLDFQLVVYMKVPLKAVAPYVPQGLRPYQLDAHHGVFYITMMRITGGSVPDPKATKPETGSPAGLAFDEILWGIRVQSVERKLHQPWSLVTGRLMTSHPASQAFLSDKDRYLVHDPKNAKLVFGVEGNMFAALTVDDEHKVAPICAFDLGDTPLVEDRWALLPGPAEVFKPPYKDREPLLRYDFTYVGLMQLLQAHELARNATFRVWPHPLFTVPFPGSALSAPTTLIEVAKPLLPPDQIELEAATEPDKPRTWRLLLNGVEINISKPKAGSVQLLSRSIAHRPKH